MSLPVILRPAADQDLESADDWYEQRLAGLGQEFLAAVSVALDRIADMPEMSGFVSADVRK